MRRRQTSVRCQAWAVDIAFTCMQCSSCAVVHRTGSLGLDSRTIQVGPGRMECQRGRLQPGGCALQVQILLADLPPTTPNVS